MCIFIGLLTNILSIQIYLSTNINFFPTSRGGSIENRKIKLKMFIQNNYILTYASCYGAAVWNLNTSETTFHLSSLAVIRNDWWNGCLRSLNVTNPAVITCIVDCWPTASSEKMRSYVNQISKTFHVQHIKSTHRNASSVGIKFAELRGPSPSSAKLIPTKGASLSSMNLIHSR